VLLKLPIKLAKLPKKTLILPKRPNTKLKKTPVLPRKPRRLLIVHVKLLRLLHVLRKRIVFKQRRLLNKPNRIELLLKNV
jgi:hypothetical protein